MSFLVAVVATLAGSPPEWVASAQVTVEIVRPVIVRQTGGPEHRSDTPHYRITRRGAELRVEFD